ncbi:MAG: peroxiredoxin [Chloroherpetonaceae bacterium]|nr:peroxiredoxin [Chthonomonadaceae bacterium]MDW8209282.1 peroxiredoxin [Chloroherpetonaceae bacterium]
MEGLQPRSALLPVGMLAPDFEAVTDRGETVRLSDWRGRKRVVLVFYPGDDTPVCTAQLCALRDHWSALEARDAVVLGINPAAGSRHRRFAERHRFSFPLVVDAGGRIAAAYGCRGLFGWVRRTVYVVDRQGRVVMARRGNPAPAVVLGVLRDLEDDMSVVEAGVLSEGGSDTLR